MTTTIPPLDVHSRSPNFLGPTSEPFARESPPISHSSDGLTSGSLPELPLISFDTGGTIINFNEKARELFHPSKSMAVQDLMFAPNYFMEMTHSSFLVGQRHELIWGVDWRLPHDAILTARVKVVPDPAHETFSAQIDPLGAVPKIDSFLSVCNACVIEISQEFMIIAAEGTERILGLPPENLLGEQSKPLFLPEDWITLKTILTEFPDSPFSLLLHHQTVDCGKILLVVSGIKKQDSGWHCVIRKHVPSADSKRVATPPNKVHRPERPLTPSISPLPAALQLAPPRTASPIPRLDLSNLPTRPATVVTTPRTHLPNFTILLVEDNLLNQMTMKRLLGSLNQTVVCVAGNGMEALDSLNSTSKLPDLIITDRNMPKMDGLVFLKDLRANPRLKDIPCMLWSDDLTGIDQRMVEELKISQFLKKPCLRDDMEKKLYEFSTSRGDSSPRKRTLNQHVQSNKAQQVKE